MTFINEKKLFKSMTLLSLLIPFDIICHTALAQQADIQNQNMTNTSAVNIPSQNTQPVIPGMQPIQGTAPATTGPNFANLCGNQQPCNIKVNTGMELVTYLSSCNKLDKATISWHASPNVILTIKQTATNFCSMRIENNMNPQKKVDVTCEFNQQQIKMMTSPSAQAAIKEYDRTHQDINALKETLNPIFDCMNQNAAPPKAAINIR